MRCDVSLCARFVASFPTIWANGWQHANGAQASATNDDESRLNDIRRVFSGPAVDSLACFFFPPHLSRASRLQTLEQTRTEDRKQDQDEIRRM